MKAFAPRLGIAWDPTGTGKLLVTSAYAIFYEPYYTGQGGPLQAPISAPPFLGTPQVSLPNFADPFNGKDRKSTRLNSSHMSISYAVFCLKKKKMKPSTTLPQNPKYLFCPNKQALPSRKYCSIVHAYICAAVLNLFVFFSIFFFF